MKSRKIKNAYILLTPVTLATLSTPGTLITLDLYAALGRPAAGRYVIVFFILKNGKEALIISARDMDNKERQLYDRK